MQTLIRCADCATEVDPKQWVAHGSYTGACQRCGLSHVPLTEFISKPEQDKFNAETKGEADKLSS